MKNEIRSRAFFSYYYTFCIFFLFQKLRNLRISFDFMFNVVVAFSSSLILQCSLRLIFKRSTLKCSCNTIFFSLFTKTKQQMIKKYLQQYRVVYKQFGWGIFLIIEPDFGGKKFPSASSEKIIQVGYPNWLMCLLHFRCCCYCCCHNY